MAVFDFESIRKEIRLENGDIDGIRWSDDELDIYINEAQREYAYKTLAFSKEIPFTLEAYTDLLPVPSDYIMAEKVVVKNREMPVYDKGRAIDDYNVDFMRRSDRVRAVSFSFDSWNLVRFIPTPQESLAGVLFYKRLPVKDKLEVTNTDILMLYSLFQCYLRESDIEKASHYLGLFEKMLVKDERGSVKRGKNKRRGVFF